MQTLDGVVHHAHVLTYIGRSRYGCVLSWGEHFIHQVDSTVVGKQHLLDFLYVSLVEHRVLCIVLDGFELTWHRVAELLFHQVIDKRLNHVARNLVHCTIDAFLVFEAFHGSQLFRSISLQEEASTARLREEILVQAFVRWRENHTHVLFLCHGPVCLIFVPSWVESQAELHGAARRVALWVGACIVIERTEFLRIEIALLEHRVHVVAVQQTVASRQVSIIEWSREAVHQVAEDVRVAIRAHHLGHVLRSNQHLVQTVHISVLASDVLFHYLAVVDEGIVLIAFLSHDDFEVLVGNLLVCHLLGEEMRHHLVRVVESHVDTALRWIAEASPVVEVFGIIADRQLVGVEVRHRVEYVGSRLTAKALTCLWSHRARHHFQQVGVVHHGRVQNQLLLVSTQLVVVAHVPVVVGKELVEGVVVSNEQRLTTSLGQHFCIVQVVNQTNEVCVVPFLF